ncbi:hypothetical protein, partial [Bradyrhizobium canariense]|uniref:hypothetical protein n=1 Tax=Bradyrhizobium canariense TaxID=255045 RepID=UPI001AEC7370
LDAIRRPPGTLLWKLETSLNLTKARQTTPLQLGASDPGGAKGTPMAKLAVELRRLWLRSRFLASEDVNRGLMKRLVTGSASSRLPLR